MDQRLIRRWKPQFSLYQWVRGGGGTLRNEKVQDCLSLRWINDSDKRCQVVEDVNLQLGSEEWLIRRHLWINDNQILCDIMIEKLKRQDSKVWVFVYKPRCILTIWNGYYSFLFLAWIVGKTFFIWFLPLF